MWCALPEGLAQLHLIPVVSAAPRVLHTYGKHSVDFDG